MIFESLYGSDQKKQLILVDKGYCRFNLRKDGQLTIYEIISQKRGQGSLMLNRLESVIGAESIFAKCPTELPSNAWYDRKGFVKEGQETTPSGTTLNLWRKKIDYTQRKPNVGDLEVIYCAGGQERKAEISLDAGWIYGARLPHTCYYRPYFTDQNFKKVDRVKYMAGVKLYRPHMATVLDWERWEQFDTVMSWAEEISQYVQVIIIVPKVLGSIKRIPTTINGKEVRLGYSVPTKYGGTKIPLEDFKGHPIHLLGGYPQIQMEIYKKLKNDIRSVDCNIHNRLSGTCQFWTPTKVSIAAARHWPKLKEVGGYLGSEPLYEAFRRSSVNIINAWKEMIDRLSDVCYT